MTLAKQPIISVENLSVDIRARKILDDISFSLKEGDLNIIVGPNGAGKSNLLKSIAGVNDSAVGSVLVSGNEVITANSEDVSQLISWSPENIDIPFSYTSRDLCVLGRYPWHKGYPNSSDTDKVEQVFLELGISHLSGRSVTTLSSGEKKKVLLARALSSDACIILLDEPTANLDIHAKEEVLSALKRYSMSGKTIVTVIHDINLAFKHADRVILIDNGKLHSIGSPEETLSYNNILSVFKQKSEVITLNDGSKHLITYS